MPNLFDITEFILEEVSLVDDPANQEAKVALFKRNNHPSGAPDDKFGVKERPMPDNKSPEQQRREELLLEKGIKQEQVDLIEKSGLAELLMDFMQRAEAAEKLCEKAMDDASTIEDVIKAAGGEIADGKLVMKKAEEPEYIEVDGEKVLKSAIPAPLLRKMEKQNDDLQELKKERELEKLEKRAEKELPHLGGSNTAKGQLLKAIDGLGKSAAEELHRALKAADAAVSKMFDEVGKAGGDDEGTAASDLRKMAEAHAEAKNVSYETAFSDVIKTKRGKELLSSARAEQ